MEFPSEPFAEEFEFDDSKQNYLIDILWQTIYSDEKKKDYERIIKAGLTMNEYETLKLMFYADKVDNVTMRGNYGQRELIKHLGKL